MPALCAFADGVIVIAPSMRVDKMARRNVGEVADGMVRFPEIEWC